MGMMFKTGNKWLFIYLLALVYHNKCKPVNLSFNMLACLPPATKSHEKTEAD